MAVIIKRKAAQDLTTRQQDALESVFGTEEHTAFIPDMLHGIGRGSKVIITNDKFPWVKHFQPGDTGVVELVHPQASLKATAPGFDPLKDGLYKVLLDNPRLPTFKSVDFPRWAIEPVGV